MTSREAKVRDTSTQVVAGTTATGEEVVSTRTGETRVPFPEGIFATTTPPQRPQVGQLPGGLQVPSGARAERRQPAPYEEDLLSTPPDAPPPPPPTSHHGSEFRSEPEEAWQT